MNYFYYMEQQERYQKFSWRERLFIDIRPHGVMVDDCSTGLEQIFCSTAIKSNNYAIGKHLLSGKTYKWSNWKHRKKVYSYYTLFKQYYKELFFSSLYYKKSH